MAALCGRGRRSAAATRRQGPSLNQAVAPLLKSQLGVELAVPQHRPDGPEQRRLPAAQRTDAACSTTRAPTSSTPTPIRRRRARRCFRRRGDGALRDRTSRTFIRQKAFAQIEPRAHGAAVPALHRGPAAAAEPPGRVEPGRDANPGGRHGRGVVPAPLRACGRGRPAGGRPVPGEHPGDVEHPGDGPRLRPDARREPPALARAQPGHALLARLVADRHAPRLLARGTELALLAGPGPLRLPASGFLRGAAAWYPQQLSASTLWYAEQVAYLAYTLEPVLDAGRQEPARQTGHLLGERARHGRRARPRRARRSSSSAAAAGRLKTNQLVQFLKLRRRPHHEQVADATTISCSPWPA